MKAMDRSGRKEELLRWLQKGEPAFLAWYIGQHCHQRILSDFPLLLVDLEELVRDTIYCYPHLEEVHLHLSLIYLELCEHMGQEKSLFLRFFREKEGLTAIERLKKASLPFTARELVEVLEQEHGVVREGWRKIRALCHQYQAPLQDAVLKEMYHRLAECEKKIQYCLQLEDRLLSALKYLGEDERNVPLF